MLGKNCFLQITLCTLLCANWYVCKLYHANCSHMSLLCKMFCVNWYVDYLVQKLWKLPCTTEVEKIIFFPGVGPQRQIFSAIFYKIWKGFSLKFLDCGRLYSLILRGNLTYCKRSWIFSTFLAYKGWFPLKFIFILQTFWDVFCGNVSVEGLKLFPCLKPPNIANHTIVM